MHLALCLILAGIVISWLAPSVPGVLSIVVYWIGVWLAIVGLALLPVPTWLSVLLRSMLGGGGRGASC